MRRIDDRELLDAYIAQHGLQELCGFDLAGVASLFRFEKDELILSTHRMPRHIFFMVKGEARVYSYTATSKTLSCGNASDFALFGEAAALWGKTPSNNVQAMGACDCVGIDLACHRELLLNDANFLRYVAQTLAERLTREQERTSLDPLDVRLARFVLANAPDGTFNRKLTEASEVLNVSYRHLLRVVKELCEQEMLAKQGRSYRIADQRALERLADGMAE